MTENTWHGASQRPSQVEPPYESCPGRLIQRTNDDEPLQNPNIAPATKEGGSGFAISVAS